MVATDLYNNPAGMLTSAERYAPFPFRRECLEVRQMSGLALEYPAGHFDFAFCLSSIEHFGTRTEHSQSVRRNGKGVETPRKALPHH